MLLDLFCHHSISQSLHPSRCSAQSLLSWLSVAANDHPNCLAWERLELLRALASSSPVLETRLSRWPWWFTRPDCSIPHHLCTTLECVPRQSLHFSTVTRLFAAWNASHNSGPDATLRSQQQMLLRFVHTAYPDRFDPTMTTSPNGTSADSYRQPLVLSCGVCFVL